MICASFSPCALIVSLSAWRSVCMRVNAVSSGLPSGRSARLIRTSITCAPYWRAWRSSALRMLRIAVPRSAVSSAAKGRRPSSWRSTDDRIGDSCARRLSSDTALCTINTGSMMRNRA
jgi:hypothetical protein